MIRRLFTIQWPRLRLTVRVVMGLVLILGCGIGWLVHSARVQHDAVAAIRKAGGTVYYDWDFLYKPNLPYELTLRPNGRPPRPKWLVDFLGPDLLGRVRVVGIGRAKDLDSVMREIGRLSQLEVLTIYNSGGLTEVGSRHFGGLSRLRFLSFDGTALTGAVLKDVATLRRLERLELQSSDLSDTDLSALGGMTGLTFLRLRCSNLTDAGLVPLCGLKNLTYLNIGPCRITDAGLEPLVGLTRLRKLFIEVPDLIELLFMKPRDAGPQLGMLAKGYGVTDQGVSRLQKKMPRTQIIY